MHVIGAQLFDLARRLGLALQNRGLQLVTAESCTAGGVAYAITQIAGSSAWFDSGLVVYSNAAKQRLLGVPAQVLQEFGAVSEPVARALALGALGEHAGRAALAVTGIAGPDGGSALKPVGTVCFAWALRRGNDPGVEMQSATRHFAGDRAAVRTQSIACALHGMIDLVRATPAAR